MQLSKLPHLKGMPSEVLVCGLWVLYCIARSDWERAGGGVGVGACVGCMLVCGVCGGIHCILTSLQQENGVGKAPYDTQTCGVFFTRHQTGVYAARDFDLQCTVRKPMEWWVHCIGTLHSEQHCGLVVANGYVFEVPSLNFGTSREYGQGGRLAVRVCS